MIIMSSAKKQLTMGGIQIILSIIIFIISTGQGEIAGLILYSGHPLTFAMLGMMCFALVVPAFLLFCSGCMFIFAVFEDPKFRRHGTKKP